ncbi:hypothetical protein DVVG_00048 [Dunaliella viridis virus SI2]|uniref:hypothetical protein n=1 Tax=Dunaliella viridis virus SI2 TaxID=754069 RepID=UPI0002C0B9A3|nr:hypothetical protein DVVG_00048 [Dunaliella viridis virus SI2]AGH16034.1 hypothetical protein DVVG_00048 [Dunaliella viridis virus SI2]
MTVDPFSELMDMASDPLFRDQVSGVGSEVEVNDTGLDNAIYLACFATPAGRAVLADLYNRFVNGTRFEPGQDPSIGYYREGGAYVVFDIAARIEAAAQGDEEETQDAQQD